MGRGKGLAAESRATGGNSISIACLNSPCATNETVTHFPRGATLNGRMTHSALKTALIAGLLLAGCSKVKLPQIDLSDISLPSLGSAYIPLMRWDHRPEAQEWTTATLSAIAAQDASLASNIPSDINAWCPGYPKATVMERRAFWSGLLSAVSKYESASNPKAAGGGGRYIGLMQISPKTAANYGCEATSSKALKDGAANLQCAVKIAAIQVGKDGVVAGKGNRGVGRDWMPLRNAKKRAEMQAWLSRQTYCQ